MICLYHGSTVDIDRIDLAKSRPNKDFGRGFYLSADRHQAWRMGEFKALTEGGTPVLNTYLFDEQVLASGDLRVLIFKGYTREWAEFIFLNRNNRIAEPAHDYDIVYLLHVLGILQDVLKAPAVSAMPSRLAGS